MFCSKCGAEIADSSAAFCPKCGNALAEPKAKSKVNGQTQQPKRAPQPKERRSKATWIFFVIAAIIVIAAASSNSPHDTAPTSSSGPAAGTASSGNFNMPTAPALPGVGGSHETGTWRITVNNAYVTRVIDEQDNEFMREVAGDGEVFVVVDVTFENTTKETKSFSSMLEPPRIVTGDGYEYDVDFNGTIALRNSFQDGDITPGLKKRGQWAFKVRRDATNVHFRIAFTRKPYDWRLWDTLPQ